MPQAPPDVEPTIVASDLTEAQLETYLQSPEVAVDTETLGLSHVRDRLCVVQLCNRAGQGTLVQISREQLANPDVAQRAPRLRTLLEHPEILKVFHFARFDVGALRLNLGIHVAPLYCTRTVSRLVRTYTDKHGLRDVCLELLDVELEKVTTHSDWSQPQLSPRQVRYAISDVTLLLPLKDRLDEMLQRQERAALARDCFAVIPTMAALDLLGFDLLFEHH